MEDLRERIKRFALRIIRMYAALPKEQVAQVWAYGQVHRLAHITGKRAVRGRMLNS